jgi:hypothetical protein
MSSMVASFFCSGHKTAGWLVVGGGLVTALAACGGSDGEPNSSAGAGSGQAGGVTAGTGTATAGTTGVGTAGTGTATGGTGSSAGTASGGSSSAGASTAAGTASGGTSSAGTSSGGTSSGGTSSGGTSSGGTSSGGTSSGGTSSGGTSSGGTSSAGTASGGSGGGGTAGLAKFSFFVTSMKKMVELGGANGFGGDLRFGTASGLEGADKICTTIAESSMPGSGAKKWHAFLSTEKGGANDGPVHAKDRIGTGPWYDRTGRLVSMNLTNLLKDRPSDADAAIKNDLPNENGIPNKQPDPSKPEDDTHHFLTGSKATGEWYGKDLHGNSSTCLDWTTNSRKNIASATGEGAVTGRPQIGFSFIAGNRTNWISGQTEGGCGAGITGVGMSNGGSMESNPIVGSGGGYGGIYCFAMTP